MGTIFYMSSKKYILIKNIDKSVELAIYFTASSDNQLTFNIYYLTKPQKNILQHLKTRKKYIKKLLSEGMAVAATCSSSSDDIRQFLLIFNQNDFVNFIDQTIDVIKNYKKEIVLFDLYGSLDKNKKIYFKLIKYCKKETLVQFIYNNRFSNEDNNLTCEIVCNDKYIKNIHKIGKDFIRKMKNMKIITNTPTAYNKR